MLQALKIRNYALINEAEISFTKGFNVITGETGAGKSILLGALGLILGNRADSGVLYNQDEKCYVEGVFDLRKLANKGFFEEHNFDFDEETVIRREINPQGKSRAFINDTPASLNDLKEFAESMIDIHSQHQTLQLNDSTFQLSVLDSFCNNKNLLAEYKTLFKQYNQQKHQLEELKKTEFDAKKDLDYIDFQRNEIQALKINVENDQVLEEELNLLSNAEMIKSKLDKVIFLLDESETSVSTNLNEIRRDINDIISINSKIENIYRKIESVSLEINDFLPDLINFRNSVESDDERKAEISERIDSINRLLFKHRFQNIDELVSYEKKLTSQINEASSLENEILLKEKEIENLKKELYILADKLSKLRKSSIPEVKKELLLLLKQVGMKDASLEIELNKTEISSFGQDTITILFSSNKGVSVQPISKVASGGELSRLMLCVKNILAGSTLLPTIIFDEIDLGISGEVAIKVGNMLSKMSSFHQIISITHLPQVAAQGNSHFLVYKITDQKSTYSKIKRIEANERELEIAKMIGGDQPSESAINNASELLNKFS